MSVDRNQDTAVHARIYGRVQGVGFRFFVQAQARRLGVRGWVRNEYDGSVEVSCEGSAAGVDRFLKQLKKGPPGARVDRVEASPMQYQGLFRGFTIEP